MRTVEQTRDALPPSQWQAFETAINRMVTADANAAAWRAPGPHYLTLATARRQYEDLFYDMDIDEFLDFADADTAAEIKALIDAAH